MSSGPPPVPGGRTPEEREAARRAREARRAARAGELPRGPAQGDGAARPAIIRERAERARKALRRRAPAGRERPGRGGARRPGRLVAGLAAAAVALAAAWFLLSLLQPFAGDGEGEVAVVIPEGAGVRQIADVLAERGVVPSGFFFEARATLSGRRGELKPGFYRLRRDMSYGAVLDALAEGPPADIVTLTVPEGRSRREVARMIGDSLRGDYLAATRSSSALDPRRYGASGAATLEGFLFPATYELKRGAPVRELVRQQLAEFKRGFSSVSLRYARARDLTPFDVLTIASMVEREAQVAGERRLIASVIYNRLRAGMPLGIDATIRFATGNWTRPLRRSELRSPSPYNTRTRRGLPPGPIGNPGLAAIRAAADPARTRFLYYVVKPGTCPVEHDFSRTEAEFQRDVARYDRERAKRGGKSPTDC